MTISLQKKKQKKNQAIMTICEAKSNFILGPCWTVIFKVIFTFLTK